MMLEQATPISLPQSASATSAARPAVRVLLVDHHRLMLDALGASLARRDGIRVVGAVESLAELARARVSRPNVVLMDDRLRDGTGAEGTRIVKARWPEVHVLLLTAMPESAAVLEAVRAGAEAVISKSGGLDDVLDAIRGAADGQAMLSRGILAEMTRHLAAVRPARVLAEPLTARELTVLKALALGHGTSRIANDLGLSPATVRVHVEAIRRKFRVATRLAAVSAAIRHGIVELPVT